MLLYVKVVYMSLSTYDVVMKMSKNCRREVKNS